VALKGVRYLSCTLERNPEAGNIPSRLTEYRMREMASCAARALAMPTVAGLVYGVEREPARASPVHEDVLDGDQDKDQERDQFQPEQHEVGPVGNRDPLPVTNVLMATKARIKTQMGTCGTRAFSHVPVKL